MATTINSFISLEAANAALDAKPKSAGNILYSQRADGTLRHFVDLSDTERAEVVSGVDFEQLTGEEIKALLELEGVNFDVSIGADVVNKSGDYTLVQSDHATVLNFTGDDPATISVPGDLVFPFAVTVIQDGLGQVTFLPTSGAQVNSTIQGLKTQSQDTRVTLVMNGSGKFNLSGSLLVSGTSASVLNVTNFYNPVRNDAEVNKVYGSNGVVGTLNGFNTTGLFPVDPARDLCVSVSAAERFWNFYDALNFYDASGAHLGQIRSADMSLSGDLRTMTVSKSVFPAGTAQGSACVKYLANNGTGFITGVETPPAFFADLLNYICVNHSAQAACYSPFDAIGTVVEAQGSPQITGDDMLLIRNGIQFYVRTYFNGTQDLVHFYDLPGETIDFNSDVRVLGASLIPSGIPAAYTPSAHAATRDPLAADDDIVLIGGDDAAAVRAFNDYVGSAHSRNAQRFRATGHPFTNEDCGQIRVLNGREVILARVIGNDVVLCPRATGTFDNYDFNDSALTVGTYTYVSGGGNEADLVLTAALGGFQLFPGLYGVIRTLVDQNGREIVDSGVYRGTEFSVYETYRVPNMFAAMARVETLVGTSDVIKINDDSIAPMFEVNLQYKFAPRGGASQLWQITAKQDFDSDLLGGMQFAKLNINSDGGANDYTLHYLVPTTQSFQAGRSNNAGSARDFSAWQDMTANTLEYYFQAPSFGASQYLDGVTRPPRLTIMETRDTGGAVVRRFAMLNDMDKGRTANAQFGDMGLFISASEKAYPVTRGAYRMLNGETESIYSAWQVLDPNYDPQSVCNLVYSYGGGKYGMAWETLNTLTDYRVPVPSYLVGKRIRYVDPRTGITHAETVVDAAGILVTTTGPSGFTAVIV